VWLAFEDPESELEFEHYLALKLGMTVRDIRQMGNDEFVRWTVYYAREAQRMELAPHA
jgi:hypothetical protein